MFVYIFVNAAHPQSQLPARQLAMPIPIPIHRFFTADFQFYSSSWFDFYVRVDARGRAAALVTGHCIWKIWCRAGRRWCWSCVVLPKSCPAAMSKSKPRATIVITRADAYTIEGLGIGNRESGTRDYGLRTGGLQDELGTMASGLGWLEGGGEVVQRTHCSPKDALHFNEDIRREQRVELRCVALRWVELVWVGRVRVSVALLAVA